MNPIKFQEYEDYKKNQKQISKESQWHEFLKLDKKQYLNFRVSRVHHTIAVFQIYSVDFLNGLCCRMIFEIVRLLDSLVVTLFPVSQRGN